MSATSSGSGDAAGRDVTKVGPLTINNNLGSASPELSVQADHYDAKVAEIARLQQENQHLATTLADTRAELARTDASWTQKVDDLVARHADELRRSSDVATARQAATEQALTDCQHELDALRATFRQRRVAPATVTLAEAASRTARRIDAWISQVNRSAWRSSAVGLLTGTLLAGGGAALAWPEAVAVPSAASTEPTSPPPSAELITFTDIPCAQGAWAVRFASYVSSDGTYLGIPMDDALRARLKELKSRQTLHSVKPVEFDVAGPDQDVCPGLQRGDTATAHRTYVYAGPMSKADAWSLCRSLKYLNLVKGVEAPSNDCWPVPLADA